MKRREAVKKDIRKMENFAKFNLSRYKKISDENNDIYQPFLRFFDMETDIHKKKNKKTIEWKKKYSNRFGQG